MYIYMYLESHVNLILRDNFYEDFRCEATSTDYLARPSGLSLLGAHLFHMSFYGQKYIFPIYMRGARSYIPNVLVSLSRRFHMGLLGALAGCVTSL